MARLLHLVVNNPRKVIMTNANVSRRSSSGWDTLFKTDYPRAIDDRIGYFGELPTSPRTSRPVPDGEATLRTSISRSVYGACESCGKPIPLGRLLALQAVRFCLGCQASIEASPRSCPALSCAEGRLRAAGWPTTQSWDGRRRA